MYNINHVYSLTTVYCALWWMEIVIWQNSLNFEGLVLTLPMVLYALSAQAQVNKL